MHLPLGRPRLWQMPTRLVTGAFILNSGLGKRSVDDATAARLRGFASVAFPMFANVPADRFARGLSTGEIVLGAALLAPIVPPFPAGAALTAFSAGLLRMYLKSPDMHEPGSLKPTQQGTALAKDVWMLGIGVGLMLDGLVTRHR